MLFIPDLSGEIGREGKRRGGGENEEGKPDVENICFHEAIGVPCS